MTKNQPQQPPGFPDRADFARAGAEPTGSPPRASRGGVEKTPGWSTIGCGTRARRATAIAIFLFLLSSARSANAGELKGVVRENELGGPTVANVPISAPGANPKNTDRYGQFTLVFPDKNAGESVTVSVTRVGYVVVNDIQLEEVLLPANPDTKPLMILICPKNKRVEMALQFYRLVMRNPLEATYQKRLKELQDQQAASAGQIALLQQERDQAKATAEKMAGQLALAQPVSTYRELAQKNPDTYLPDVARTLNNLGVLDSAQNRTDQARLNFQEALKTYGELAQKNPDTYLPDVARTLNNLGNLDHDQNRMDQARVEYKQALMIQRELAQKNPDTYPPDVATTLNNLGNVDRDQNRMDQARVEYEEALMIQRELAQKNPDTYLPDVARTLNNLGVLDSAQNRMDQARLHYEIALATYRELAQKNPDTYLPDVAGTLNNLGILDSAQNRMDQARLHYEIALATYRDLGQKNPDTYLPYVAATLNNLGVLDRNQNLMDQARLDFQEALGIFQRFAASNPERFSKDVDRVKGLIAKLPAAK